MSYCIHLRIDKRAYVACGGRPPRWARRSTKYSIYLFRPLADRIAAMREPHETYSDVILRLAAAELKLLDQKPKTTEEIAQAARERRARPLA